MSFCFHRTLVQLSILGLSLGLLACDGTSEPASQGPTFLKAEPAVDAQLDFPPGSLRVYFSALPNVDESSMSLTGPEAEVPLSGLHTMGADDLMIGIDQYPLPAGQYTVQWNTRFTADGPELSGDYNFTIKPSQD